MRALQSIVIVIVLFITGSLQAQTSLNVNVGTPPLWGPAGYSDVRYYYLPDVEAYYDVQASRFIYYRGGVWNRRSYLPTQYSDYDLYNGYKVVMVDYHGKSPYKYFKEHKVKYPKGYKGTYQNTIGEKPGKGNSNDKNMKKNHGGGNGKKK